MNNINFSLRGVNEKNSKVFQSSNMQHTIIGHAKDNGFLDTTHKLPLFGLVVYLW